MHYHVQWIKFRQQTVPIVLQYVNGPCPLLALVNVLFLRGKLSLPGPTLEVSFDDLLKLLTNFLQRQVQDIALRDSDPQRVASSLQNLEDAIGIMPTLEKGLDINVRFEDPLAYEFTKELALFDLCAVRMVHGWSVG
jgi:hypothetical protein